MNLDELRQAIEAMTDDERATWVEALNKAAANLGNAAYGLAGNVPDAKPDPLSWSLTWLHVGIAQFDYLTDSLTKKLPSESKS